LNLYFDSAYVAKCYLPEPGAEKVRAVARSASGLYSSSVCIAELACVFQRQIREFALPGDVIATLRRQFQEDLQGEVWRLIPITDRLLYRVDAIVRSLPVTCLIRAGAAIHIASAIDSGFEEIWTNDRRLLAAAEATGLRPRSIEHP
jgi:predicted nucleic acid-binding protein